MEPEHLRFGGGSTETVLGPAVLVGMLIAILLIFLLPRRRIVIPVLMGTFLCPMGQTLVVGGLHIFVVRILILAAWTRLLASRSSKESVLPQRFNTLDKVFLVWASLHALTSILLFMEPGAAIHQGGFLLEALGGYFLLRSLVRTDDDVQTVIKTFAVIAVILAVSMTYEHFKGFNVFGLIGGNPIIPEMRNGAFRAQGTFRHALLAGSFGATLFPLFFWLWKARIAKVLGLTGMMASSLIPFMTACSTPVLAWVGALFGLFFWPLRRRMRQIRWAIVFGLICLQLIMKAPFWWAIQHIDVVGGSSSWHRALLVDKFLQNFGDWWLIGAKDNANWGHHMWDTANQYVQEGTTGGVAALICFLALIRISFGALGKARRLIEGSNNEWYFWALGVALFSHMVAFFGVSYFDWTMIAWYTLLALIGAATVSACSPRSTKPRIKLVVGEEMGQPLFADPTPALGKEALGSTGN
jgi:hypothetical protein